MNIINHTNDTMTNYSLREVGLSVLKTICCFCAVTFYSASQLCNDLCFVNNHLLGVLYFLSIVATPLFFLINGFSDQKEHKLNSLARVNWHKIFRVFIIFMFWNTASFFLFSKNGFNSYFLQSWLLISVASIYILNPIFTILLSNKTWAYKALIFFAAFLAFLDILSLLGINGTIETIPSHFRVWTWFFYYYLGRFLALRKVRLMIKRQKIRDLAKIWCLPLLSIFYLYESLISKYLLKQFNATNFLDSFLLIAMTISIFIIFENISIKNKLLKQLFHFIAPSMIGVYILHDAVFYYLNLWYPPQTPILANLYLFIVFTLSVLIARLLLLNSYTAKLIKF